MATLSVKVSTATKDAFERWCEDHGETVSGVLRSYVEAVLRCRLLEVHDPLVGPPVGWLYIEDAEEEA